MSAGRVPAPDFDRSRYERPHRPWVCGHTCEGAPCRAGPGPSGECRATTECHPALELRPSEAKGTWKCTRPKEWGGPCAAGPMPDGTCGRAIPVCQPFRGLRNRRGLVTRATVAAAVALLLIGLAGPFRESFINPAPLAAVHSGPKFAGLALPYGGGQGCVLCHAGAGADLTALAMDAVRAARTSLAPGQLVSAAPRDYSQMDRACRQCHRAQSFHQANVGREMSCSVCHLEHQGSAGLRSADSSHCASCHGDPNEMAAAGRRSTEGPLAFYLRPLAPGLVSAAALRPAEGYTQIIHGFATDHPEFRVRQTPAADANPLRFNHRVHLTGDIPPIGGHRLDCAYCHQPDASGAFMQRVTFEKNCRACHALNFDENNPGMTLPHGDPRQIRAYLRSLPLQYTDLARRERGLTREDEIRTFVDQQMQALRLRTRSGEDLERAIFFADDQSGITTTVAGLTGPARTKFAGCALCHDLVPQGEAPPAITPPRTPDRWMLLARFNHARHTTTTCRQCHAAEQSTRTADILLPGRKTCVECHGPKGGARHDCSACHNYHNVPPTGFVRSEMSPR